MGSRRDRQGALHGLIVVDKPAGLSSAAVVDRVRARVGARRAGHTGTLDPLATGVLPVCVGEATKLAGYLIAEDKAYRATIGLGRDTDTYDATGTPVVLAPGAAARRAELIDALDAATVRAALHGHVGPLLQVPPMYSAIKVRGRRMHALARAGEEVDLPPRPVTIHRLELVELRAARDGIRELVVDLECTKGTYVRSLAFDLGRALGTGGHVVALRRTRTGAYGEAQAIGLEFLDRERARTALVPMAAITGMPSIAIDPALEKLVGLGVLLSAQALGCAPEAEIFQLVSRDGRLLAVAGVQGEQVRYHRVFNPPDAA